ncbi:hypothetical protein cce_5077 [Crocosphaera subtropica ATCC 51142]|uniref:Uncharacterized protein n=1 Tax=Crocosphaera subtropica (strain ATCC 51142 / BH68) TaxID=43989 RepID=B1X2R2_CROS5|nr:hypothetical protein cce_5077 [Crocosphaera subtropica ATCC 51142]
MNAKVQQKTVETPQKALKLVRACCTWLTKTNVPQKRAIADHPRKI